MFVQLVRPTHINLHLGFSWCRNQHHAVEQILESTQTAECIVFAVEDVLKVSPVGMHVIGCLIRRKESAQRSNLHFSRT